MPSKLKLLYQTLAAAVLFGLTGIASTTAPAPTKAGAADFWQFEDTGLVIRNDNANTVRAIVGIESMDLNGDGVMDSVLVGPEFDIGAAPPGPLPLSYFKRQSAHVLLGGATTTSGASLFPSGRPTYIASGWPISYDFNGDGRRDLFIADIGPDTPPYPGVQSVAWLSGSAGFVPATMQPSVTYMHGASAGRAAGQPVIFAHAVCCGTERVPFLYVFRNGVFEVDRSLLPSLVTESVQFTPPGGATFSIPNRIWTGSTIADVDGDGLDDLVLGNFSAANPNDPLIGNYIVFGNSSGWQSGVIVRLPNPQGGAISTITTLSVKAVDVDGDGKKDLVVSYTAFYNTRGIQILKNNGDRTFTDISTAMLGAGAYIPGSPSGNLQAVDLNGDGCIDLVEPEASHVGTTLELGRILINDCRGQFVNANAALAGVLSQLPAGSNIFPFTDFTGRTSFYVPVSESPSPAASNLYGTRYKKLKNLRNLPTPVNGAITFTSPVSTPPQTGWYWNPAESGRGFFVEKRGGNLFMSGFIYADGGRATWFIAGNSATDTLFTSSMLNYANGQTLIGSYRTPNTTASPGNITLQFSSSTQATMIWPGGTVALQRFPFGPGGAVVAPQAGAPESGWWWNASESGRGFAIEIQGNNLFVVGYMYDAAGNPLWYLSGGPMATPTTYSGVWVQYANGQTLLGPFKPAAVVNANAGTVSINFTNAQNGTMTLPDGRVIPLVRFVF